MVVDEDLRADDVSVRREHALQLLLVHRLGQVGDEHVSVLDFLTGGPVGPP